MIGALECRARTAAFVVRWSGEYHMHMVSETENISSTMNATRGLVVPETAATAAPSHFPATSFKELSVPTG